ncbi:hypothetical protein [Peredibacter starrii]|uniref:Lipoprotein n=1 Tax=Peredibacter starrii TaxID=28202 RepID=A0AAX4HUB1_9BACT|nr:hypothetical protein [Peredibacter starrii]WPU66534.1 hypothetical protein SOO65_07230 [Peredibacter starrii]
MRRYLILALTFMVSSCANISMGKIPIIVKNLDQDEINYDELMKMKSQARNTKETKKDCAQIYVFVPTKLILDLESVLKKSCNNSNYSFDNQVEDRFFYLGYGQECVVNEFYCENT